jgi:hypothetical protein
MRERFSPLMLTRRSLLAAAVITAPLAAFIAPKIANAAEAKFRLLLIEQKGCAGCAAWLREIGPTYAQNAPEAPLTRVDVHEGNWPEGIVIGGRPNVTPTFLILRDGIEVERLYGYAGAKRFWPALRAALA